MKFYLKYINPVAALIVFGLCFWLYIGNYFFHFGSPSYSDSKTPYQQGLNILMYDSLPIYFLVKGIFCSLMLFLFGKFLEYWIDQKK
ncbi:MAG TPA: hypothetical protein PKG60_05880 [Spirochaetota bacterium]|jgi:hypothetical protein|nr:hypothetical protein [Spirochaetota bacterium]HPS86531.1 hypothetical protein [Spirochaetota bacterium]